LQPPARGGLPARGTRAAPRMATPGNRPRAWNGKCKYRNAVSPGNQL
jgi:hypothetical protein